MSDRPILVTGGAGFIGSNLIDALLARGHSVRVLDNLSMGKLANLPVNDPRLTFIEGDVADAGLVSRAVAGCGAVVHLAAVASVQASVDDPVSTHQSNFIGTLNICEAMREHGVRRVVFASSAAVYGNNGEGLAIDENTAKAPLTPYAADKLASEHYLEFYARQHGLEPAIFRFFNVFGPRQDPSSPYSGVISIFTQRAQQGLPISVFGDGEQTRDFFYVADLVELLQQALDAEQVAQGAVNVGWNQTVSLKQLLAQIGELLGGLPAVTHLDPRAGDIRHSRADNGRLATHYQLPAQTTLRDGLAALLNS
ncbi:MULTISPECIES: NAD-dependent epimerase/dehydratase family protein [Pseudomonas]|uniref:NAD-dependent dehydratase n=2 Tax=Pseudomonadaceae TaxID=135621 RepID=A0A0D0KTS6_9PSED|nr:MULTISPECIES: NAD-dependent epimerase/dehydratase family protein [Pseudomonas]KIQ01621.1 NAD-dependent dehydratase [Pseudomonas fulva]MCW2290608.1 UDP-glucose 4-epimerase [Pseudomonas sp. BIGb0408]NYH74819.1 UDP-glucose 4-epimerase [Pseudomonas flavescens]